jgi:RimJ/RimL family protein N-acetyltransferase
VIHVTRIDAATWKKTFSENAHLIAFGKHKPAHLERIDFALIGAEGDTAGGYVTVREHDAESVYISYGGAFPPAMGSPLSLRGCLAFVKWFKDFGYKRATCLVANDNVPMLKMALAVGFRTIGVRLFNGKIYVEHLLEL